MIENAAKAEPVKKREIFGWAMYDFANSSYTTVVITYIYSAFFVSHIVPAESGLRDTYWALAITISTVLSVLLAPFLGAMADLSGTKKRFLIVLTTISVVFTASLFFVAPGQVWLGIAFLIFSNTAWMLSENFIASFLPEISTPKNVGAISGIGWGIGYIGGLLSLLLMIGLITADADDNPVLFVQQNQLAMVVVAVFYLLAALPTFIFLKERTTPAPGFGQTRLKDIAKTSVKRASDMVALAKRFPVLFRFFIPFTVYSAGIAVIVKFFGIYASQELQITGGFLVLVGAVLQISAMIGAIVFGFIQDKKGANFTLNASLLMWLLGLLSIYFLDSIAEAAGLESRQAFIVISFIAGSALGATQSASRAVVGLITSQQDAALSYGLWGVFGKLAIVLGMVFGPVSDAVGRHDALWVVMAYFALGMLLLRLVPLHTLPNQPPK